MFTLRKITKNKFLNIVNLQTSLVIAQCMEDLKFLLMILKYFIN